MKVFLILLILGLSCSKKETPSDDYVLIEFASKLEEDQHQVPYHLRKDKKTPLNSR